MHGVSTQQIQQVGRAIANGHGVCFVGAGLSVAAGAPNWDDLVKPLRARLTPSTRERSNTLIAQYFRNQHGANELYAYLRRQLSMPLEPTSVHRVLCKWPVNIFVTTNYDDLLEATFRSVQRNVHVIRDNDEMAMWNELEEVQLLKIHGDLNSAKDIVLTECDYIRFLSANTLIRRKLAELFCYRNVVFVGYSLRDPNVAQIFNAISHELGELKRKAYIITFDVDPHCQDEWRRNGLVPVCIAPRRERSERTELLCSLLFEIAEESKRVGRGRREILIADDDVLVRNAIERRLSCVEGLSIHTASDGLEASLMLGKIRPELLIVDLLMPKMNGIQLVKLMRQDPDLAETNVIVVTGHSNDFPEPELERLRVERIFRKPVPDEELERCVRTMLGIGASFPPYFESEYPGNRDSFSELAVPQISRLPRIDGFGSG